MTDGAADGSAHARADGTADSTADGAAYTMLLTVIPAPVPTPSPTRTPVVAVSLGVAGGTCDDFNATVFDLTFASIVKNATFSDATCVDAPSDSVVVSNKVIVPLVIAATHGILAHET